MATDFTYRLDEWQLEGSLICADVELTLHVEHMDNFGIRHAPKFSLLYAERRVAKGEPVAGAWLDFAMQDWIAANQAKLTDAYFAPRTAREAA